MSWRAPYFPCPSCPELVTPSTEPGVLAPPLHFFCQPPKHDRGQMKPQFWQQATNNLLNILPILFDGESCWAATLEPRMTFRGSYQGHPGLHYSSSMWFTLFFFVSAVKSDYHWCFCCDSLSRSGASGIFFDSDSCSAPHLELCLLKASFSCPPLHEELLYSREGSSKKACQRRRLLQ